MEEHVSSAEVTDHKEKSDIKDKSAWKEPSIKEVPLPVYTDNEALSVEKIGPLENAEEIVTHVIHVDDDPSLSPWTFRMFFIGECSTNVVLTWDGDPPR